MTFSEYAVAVEGMPAHGPEGIVKLRDVPVVISGPPKGPLALRVSTTRHGMTGKNCTGVGIGLISCASVPVLPA